MDYIIIAILLVIILLAVLRAVKHFRGGGCCGSGGGTIRDKKTLSGPQIGEKLMHIDGMHCVNCEIRVQNALNHLEGVACRVSWKKKTAVVAMSCDIPDETLKATVEKLGYRVNGITWM